MTGLLPNDELDDLLQEALELAEGRMELVARTALQELVKLKVEKLEQTIEGPEKAKRRGRPSKPGLRVPKEYREAKPLGSPNKMGLPLTSKECGETALSIQKHGVTVSDSIIFAVKSQSDKEAAERTIQALDPGWFLEKPLKHKAKIANVAKRISEARSRKP